MNVRGHTECKSVRPLVTKPTTPEEVVMLESHDQDTIVTESLSISVGYGR